MAEHEPRKHVVYWLAHFTGDPGQRGWDTKLVHPRFKDFDDPEKAAEFVITLIKRKNAGKPYQSRYVSHISVHNPDCINAALSLATQERLIADLLKD